jgi:methylenetetrahydrofolate reductase (NADPH)
MPAIGELLRRGRTFSFEFFPPKNDRERLTLVRSLRELEPLGPSFVSITYRGGVTSRQLTTDLVAGLVQTTTLTPMAHLTCTGHTRLQLAEILIDLRKSGVENLMALGGDPVEGAAPGELLHALELVELARAIGGFSIGVAAHPVGHPRSPDLSSDRAYLAEKLERADFAVTQFFFRVEEYLDLVQDLRARGLDKPVLPGIMPVTNLSSIPTMAAMGAAVPGEMVAQLEAAGPDPASVRRRGVEIFTRLCEDLLSVGAPGLHFYTLNRSSATREIFSGLSLAAAHP